MTETPQTAALPAQETGRTGWIASGLVALGLLIAAYLPTLQWLAGRWWTDPFYSHGPLVPLVSAWLLWSRRSDLRLAPTPSLAGFVLLAGAGILHLLGIRLMFVMLSAVSLVATLAGLSLLVGGRPLFRIVAFPIAYLLFAIPLPMVVLEKVSLPLQLMSSAGAGGLLGLVGVDVAREGVLLVFPEFTLAVADACSGLRSIITVLAISTLVAFLTPASPARRTALIVLASVAAVAANVVRIAVAGLVGLSFGGGTGCAFFEDYSGWLFFALVLLSSIGLAALLARPAAERPPAGTPPPPPRRNAWKFLLPAVLLMGGTAAASTVLREVRVAPDPNALSAWEPELKGWNLASVESPTAFPGEELRSGVLQGPEERRVNFTVLHSTAGRYLHSPEACSLANGWIAERMETLDVRTGDRTVPVNLWVMRRGSNRTAIVFWYLLSGEPVSGTLGHHVGAVWQRLKRGGLDSAYVEISLSLPEKGEAPDGMLLDLAGALHGRVTSELWP